jgi:hypothetical protein
MAAFASSYIKTEGSQVTRSADAASMTGANFSSWYRADEGTLYGEGAQLQGAVTNRMSFISDGTVSNYIANNINASANNSGAVLANGVAQVSLGDSLAQSGVFYRQAIAYAVNDFAFTRNGAAVSTDSSGIVPVVNTLGIGNLLTTTTGSGHIRKIAYYPKRLADAEIVALTT